MSQADAEGAAAALTRCFGEPGFAQVCVRKVLEEVPDAKALFLEMPLAAATMTTKLMEQTADRPPEQRFRPFVARIRALKADDVAKARPVDPPLATQRGDQAYFRLVTRGVAVGLPRRRSLQSRRLWGRSPHWSSLPRVLPSPPSATRSFVA